MIKQYHAKIEEYKGKFFVKIPKHISRLWDLYVGDSYDLDLIGDTVLVKFKHTTLRLQKVN